MKIRAGKTNCYCGETIRIISVRDTDNPDDQQLVGLTGKITHVFPGLIYDPEEKYKCGVYLDNPNAYSNDRCNLLFGDEFEVIDFSTAEEYPEGEVE